MPLTERLGGVILVCGPEEQRDIWPQDLTAAASRNVAPGVLLRQLLGEVADMLRQISQHTFIINFCCVEIVAKPLIFPLQ